MNPTVAMWPDRGQAWPKTRRSEGVATWPAPLSRPRSHALTTVAKPHHEGSLMPTCLTCGDHPLEHELLDHVRLIHPDVDAEPQRWPDGRPVWVDLTLDPDDFKE